MCILTGSSTTSTRSTGAGTVALAIADGTVEGRPLSTEEQIGTFVFLIIAGHETTVHGLSAMLYFLATVDGLRQKVIAEPALIPRMIDECLRIESPVVGYGVHRCVGEHLALLEMRIVAEEVLSLMPDYRLPAGFRPQWSGGKMTRGLESLPVQLR